MAKIVYYSEGWGLGGIERFVMSVGGGLDHDKFTYDVFCVHDWDDSYDEAIRGQGGRRHVVFKGHKPSLTKRYMVGPREWRGFLERGDYDIAHVNIMNGAGFRYAAIARKVGVPAVIVHSHNTAFGEGNQAVKGAIHSLGKSLWGAGPYVRYACSSQAGTYLFDNRSFDVIPNPVDVERFKFSPMLRKQVRGELGLKDDQMLFGSVGRLTKEKNPLFQVRALKSLRDKGVKARLLLVGSGPEESAILQEAESLGIGGDVILVGASSEPWKYYSALDVFSMPSTFEGLGITRLEAVASGLPAVISDTVPIECFEEGATICTTQSPSQWADVILDSWKSRASDRSKGIETICRWGIDAASVSKSMQERYDSLVGGM